MGVPVAVSLTTPCKSYSLSGIRRRQPPASGFLRGDHDSAAAGRKNRRSLYEALGLARERAQAPCAKDRRNDVSDLGVSEARPMHARCPPP